MRVSAVLQFGLLASVAINGVAAEKFVSPSESVWRMDNLGGCSKPEWPKAALRNEQTGPVTLAYLIGVDGRVADSRVLKSSGFPLLDEAARVGILRCNFARKVDGGAPAQPEWQRMQYVWTLEGKGQSPAPTPALLSAAQAGGIEAQNRMAELSPNAVERAYWTQMAALQGDAGAQYRFGGMLKSGGGIDPLTDAPAPITLQQRKESGVDFKPEKKEEPAEA